MAWVVKFEDVSKRYLRGAGYATLRDDLAQLARRVIASPRGRPVPPRGILALDHLSFEVAEGEALAIIGPNGAGKTTALKLMTRICYPTAGRVRVRGRVGALIEVGSGIHPELTGRENIWLYGRIMGMSRQEISRRFDQIVDFAELDYALEMPVKMYSTGMQLRLGFAIVSHLDPEIFVVDEALAVGDTGFQTRCVERMMHLMTEGRTLVFVSHNLAAVEAICRRTIFLLGGKVEAIGETRNVLRGYLDWVDTRQLARLGGQVQSVASQQLRMEQISFHNTAGHARVAFRTGEDVEIRLRVYAEQPIVRPIFTFGISDGRPGNLILCSMLVDGHIPDVIEGSFAVSCHIRRLPLLPRVYQTWCAVGNGYTHEHLLKWQMVGAFRVAEGPSAVEGPAAIAIMYTDAPFHVDYEWQW